MRACTALLLLGGAGPVHAGGTLKICTDTNFWYPFTFVENGRSVGLHVDVVQQALAPLDYTLELTPLPWKRCLHDAEQGRFDAVLTASYQPQRAEFLHYPADAAEAAPSKWRVTQVEYVVVTAAGDPYEFGGDVRTLPRPVRAPHGYSVIDDLKREGVAVEGAPGDENNLRKLVRDRAGVVITIPEVVRVLGAQDEFAGKLRICQRPISSKSYFLAFAKKDARLAAEARQAAWDAIARLRDDAAVMAVIARRYSGERAP